jgi:hypothetical protein
MDNSHQEESTMNQSAERTTHKMADEARRASKHIAEQSERAAHANVEIMTSQAEALEHIWRSGNDLAARLTARSADQLARALGIGSQETGQTAQQVASNIGAIMQSSSVVAQGAGAISAEWMDFACQQTERSLQHMQAVIRSRTPQDLAAAQSAALRDQIEGLIKGARRIAELTLQTADEVSSKVSENVEHVRHAA